MKLSAYVLVFLSSLLLAGALVTIVILLDDGAQTAINNVIHTLQKKTLLLSSTTVKQEVLKVVPVLDRFHLEIQTGWGDCANMDKTNLKFFFEGQIRTLMMKSVVYVYISEIRIFPVQDDPMMNWWQDCNCFWSSGELVCQRPVGEGYEETYPTGGLPYNVSAPITVRLHNYTEEYYVQRIASLRREKDINGSWSAPYYYFDDDSQEEFALQTLSVPLDYTTDGRCIKAASVDVSLRYVGKALADARASSDSLLYILDPDSEVIVSTSDTSMTLWNADKLMWPATSSPDSKINDVSQTFLSSQSKADILAHPNEYFSNFETSIGGKTYLIATMHVRHKNLLWVMIDVTPRDFYYKTLDDARAVSVSVGSVIGAIAIAVTVAVFVYLIHNLNVLGKEMDKLATMDVDSAPIPANTIAEIDHLIEIFNLVVKNLKLFKSLMPSSAFDAMGDDEEEVNDEDDGEINIKPMKTRGDDDKQEDDPQGTTANVEMATPKSSHLSGGNNSRSSKIQVAKGNLKDAFALRLEPKQASLLEVRIRDFCHLAMTGKSDVVVDLHGKHITIANEILKEHKGMLGSVNADRLYFHWNVQNKISGAPPKVAKAALMLQRAESPVSIIMVAHTCRLVGGYMGTEGIRGYQLVGPHIDLMNKMFFRIETNMVRLLCSFAFRQEVWTNFDVREVDEMEGMRLFEILSEAKQNEDEWMYQLEGNDAKTGKHAAFDQGWTAWREKKHEEAVKIMEGYCSANPNDVVAKELLGRWSK